MIKIRVFERKDILRQCRDSLNSAVLNVELGLLEPIKEAWGVCLGVRTIETKFSDKNFWFTTGLVFEEFY